MLGGRTIDGQAGTAAPDGAAGRWHAFLDAFLSHGRDAPQALGALLAADADDAVARAVKGYALLLLARGELLPAARAALAEGEAALARWPDARAAQYLAGLAQWLAGHPRGAVRALEQIIGDHPRDVLAIKLSHAIRFMAGDLEGMRRSVARVVSVFTDGVPFAGYIKGCYAFALEETGDHAGAERMGRRAAELAPRDAWGRHAVAHVLEMGGRASEGLAFLEGDAAAFAHCNNFGNHIAWHEALFALELGRHDHVLALYDARVRHDHTDDYRDIANGASLLMRLELAGVAVGDRWEELAALAAARVSDRRLVFADLHYLLALLGAGRRQEAATLTGALLADAGEGQHHDARLAGTCGVPVAAALTAFRAGRFSETVELISPVRRQLSAIGGSHAQRDVFEQIYLEALVRSGDHERASAALLERQRARGGHNRFAAERLQRLATSAQGRLAAGLVAAMPDAARH
jgi:tetratricopeptide (TPR) repeat protein